ncbi:hypothetical protein [Streptomyces cinereoruber]|uniref:hypothetical protein n=1 Tax=Streptomyces cinereoruber TaxID=67260 RepID=UPI00362C9096
MIAVLVTCNDRDTYPAFLHPDEASRHVWPCFDLATVRQLAAQTQSEEARHAPHFPGTVHVFDNDTITRTPQALVVAVTWADIADKGVTEATQILNPNEDGLYQVGEHWGWTVTGDQPATATK